MSDNDNYEEQVELREQEAYNAAMSEAGREADRMQSEHGAYVAELEARIAKLEGELDEIKGKNIIKLLEPFTHTLGLEDEPMSVIKAGIEILLKRIAELEAQQRWIPVEERLPEDSDWVLGLYNGYRVTSPIYYDVEYGWACGETPDHWMPLPEPPEAQDADKSAECTHEREVKDEEVNNE